MNLEISDTPVACTSFVDLLRARATYQPEKLAFTFLENGRQVSASLSYAQLDRRARALAALLQAEEVVGKRAMLLYPAGLDVIVALFACLYAGVIAIPTPPPEASRLRWTMPRLKSIIDDSAATILLTNSGIIDMLDTAEDKLTGLGPLKILNTEHFDLELCEDWQAPDIAADDLAYLQYTSGSTSSPKGVMVDHSNLLHQCDNLRNGCGYDDDSVTVTWMPYFHDYGLVEGLLEPLYNGTPCYLMSPYAFVKQPYHWLQAISRYRATHSQAPNFAYALCLRRINAEQLATLDLSQWQAAGNAAEPINPDVMRDFAHRFAAAGFRAQAMSPAYGLAEATLLVSSSAIGRAPRIIELDKPTLGKGKITPAQNPAKAQQLAGCGQLLGDTRVVIVNPETQQRCASDEVGEIWVSDPSVTAGYWQRETVTDETFHAYTADTSEGPFLRTGDLGFIDQDELFVCGRSKDVIVIRGSNHSPQDIEWTVQQSHDALRPENSAAFSVVIDGEERLVVAQEVIGRRRRDLDADAVVGAIREAVSQQHELEVQAVALLNPGAVPKTSSGKIQRQSCRQLYLDGTLDALSIWQRPTASVASGDDLTQSAQTATAIETWLQRKLAELLNQNPQQIDLQQPFSRYGLDSIHAVSLAGELESWLNKPLAPTLVYDFPNIKQLAQELGAAAGDADISVGGDSPVENNEPIAIVGLACRFPGADNPETFWQRLCDAEDSITEVPQSRWDTTRLFDSEQAKPGKMNTRWGGFVEAIDEFDAGFFGISPREAKFMDPQQRLLLEVSWEALEQAGISPASLRGTQTGVFIGICNYDYGRLQVREAASQDGYSPTGSALSIAANRISYALDLRGPSIAIDTACSSSLVAVHQACRSLRAGESKLALVGGVNAILDPAATVAFSQARMMSSDGRCKTFSADADGYVRAEGCGVIAMKPLADAERDGDEVYALIRGSAVNQDGRSNGLTAPNGRAQQAVIRSALTNASVKAAQIGYVEAHGTGTALGDPIELNALSAVLEYGRDKHQLCRVGSVKTNIGHLESAAGIAGLIKTVLCLYHQQIPGNLHFQSLNPHIEFDPEKLSIPLTTEAWPKTQEPRFAGVSSFGFGGTSAHLVLEEAPTRRTEYPAPERPLHILTLSAKSEAALATLAGSYRRHLDSNPQLALADVCSAVNRGRNHLKYRQAFIGNDPNSIKQQLAELESADPATRPVTADLRHPPKIAFVFGAEETYDLRAAQDLYATQPRFCASVNACQSRLRDILQNPDFSLAYDNTESPAVDVNQPALHRFVFDYALADLWRSWGIDSSLLLGRGIGNFTAACFAGVLDLDSTLRLLVSKPRLAETAHDDRQDCQLPRQLKPAAAAIPLLLSTEGPEQDLESVDFWIQLLKQPPAEQQPIEEILQTGMDFYLDFGPGSALSAQLDARQSPGCLQCLQSDKSPWLSMLEALQRLYLRGSAIDWCEFDRGYARRRVGMPTYPFQRQSYWIDDAPADERQISRPSAGKTAIGPLTAAGSIPFLDCLEEVEACTEDEVVQRLLALDDRPAGKGSRSAIEQIKSRFDAMSSARQALIIKTLANQARAPSHNAINGVDSKKPKKPITDTELDQLSESEAEALLVKKLESLEF